MGWVFQGSPAMFDIDDYLSRYPSLIYWRTPQHAGDIVIGDRVFIWRAGTESGAIGVGKVAESPCLRAQVQYPEALGDDLWIAELPDMTEPVTGIHLEELRLTRTDGMILRDSVKGHPMLGTTLLIRMPQGTVFALATEETRAMEGLWGLSGSTTVGPFFDEGARHLRAHYVRERSPRLRHDKIAEFLRLHGRLYCELCMDTGAQKYPPDYGDRIYEVHHRAPLATASTPVKTTLDALAILCANCHRSVHATTDVDANFDLLAEHFTRS